MSDFKHSSSGPSSKRRPRTRAVVFDSDEMAARKIARSLAGTISKVYWTTSFKQAKQLIIDKEAKVLISNCQTDETISAKILAKFHDDFPKVAIIATSRLPAEEPLARAAGACAFLQKPVRSAELAETINHIKKARGMNAAASSTTDDTTDPTDGGTPAFKGL
jgi:DNA-binding NtrC family response regulator